MISVPVRVHNHDLRRVLRSVGSRPCRTRRMVGYDGRACPASKPRDRRSGGGRSVVCSQMAVRLRQPASTPVTQGQDREQAVAHAPPIPRSVMFLRTWVRGWRTRADVVADDISAGSQDEEMTRHHSSSPRGPRPPPSDAPPHQSGSDTLTHRPCRPLDTAPLPIL